MDEKIDKEAQAKRIIVAGDWAVEGEAALGIKMSVKNRPIWDDSRPHDIGLNHRISYDKARFPTVKEAYALMRPDYWMYKVDLSEAFRTVPLASMLWSKHAFNWNGVRYFDTRIPFSN